MRLSIWMFTAAMLIAATQAEAAVRWHEDFERAQQLSMQTGRPMLVHFWKTGCPPCEHMERSFFPHPDVHRAIEAGYIPVKINSSRSPNLARRFNISSLPTDVVVSPSGQVLSKTGYPGTPAKYVAQLAHFSGATGGSTSRQVAYGNENPTYGNANPAYGNADPAYGNADPAYGNADPAYGNANPAYGNGPRSNTQGDRWSGNSSTRQPYSSAAPLSQTQPSRSPAGYQQPNSQQPYGQQSNSQQPYGQQRFGQQPYGTASQPKSSPRQAGSDSRGNSSNAASWNGGPNTARPNQGYATGNPSGNHLAPQSPYDRLHQQPQRQMTRPHVSAPQPPPSGNPSRNQQRPAPTWNGRGPNVNPPQFTQPSNPSYNNPSYNNVAPNGQATQPNIQRGREQYADQYQSQQPTRQPLQNNTYNNRPQPSAPPQQDMSRFAMAGHCVVTLQEQQKLHHSQRRWTPGDERWGARHEGRVYLFAGPEEQRKFLANPARYAPVLQGNDPVLALDRQQMIPGQRQHGVYYEGRIYLFANENTLRHFSTNPRRYGPRALQAVKPQDTTRR